MALRGVRSQPLAVVSASGVIWVISLPQGDWVFWRKGGSAHGDLGRRLLADVGGGAVGAVHGLVNDGDVGLQGALPSPVAMAYVLDRRPCVRKEQALVLDEARPDSLLAQLQMAFEDGQRPRAQCDPAVLAGLGDILMDPIHARLGDAQDAMGCTNAEAAQ